MWRADRGTDRRKQAAGQFLIPRADGFSPPSLIRDELYARARQLPKTANGNGLFDALQA